MELRPIEARQGDFEPQSWLDAFEAVGGGWIVRDCLSLVMQVEDRSDADLSAARQMIVELTRDQRNAVMGFLRAREAGEA
jgi:hypothetical protein